MPRGWLSFSYSFVIRLSGWFAGVGTPPPLVRFESLSVCFCVLACLLGEPFRVLKCFPAQLELSLGVFCLQSGGFGFDLRFRGFSEKILHTLRGGTFLLFSWILLLIWPA